MWTDAVAVRHRPPDTGVPGLWRRARLPDRHRHPAGAGLVLRWALLLGRGCAAVPAGDRWWRWALFPRPRGGAVRAGHRVRPAGAVRVALLACRARWVVADALRVALLACRARWVVADALRVAFLACGAWWVMAGVVFAALLAFGARRIVTGAVRVALLACRARWIVTDAVRVAFLACGAWRVAARAVLIAFLSCGTRLRGAFPSTGHH